MTSSTQRRMFVLGLLVLCAACGTATLDDAQIPALADAATVQDASTALKGSASGCRPTRETTDLPGNSAEYVYGYATTGRLTEIERFIGNHVLQDSIEVGSTNTVNQHGLDYPAGSNVVTTNFEPHDIFDGFPDRAEVALTEGAITHTNQMSFAFSYDTADRLSEVREQTELVSGDNEYDLTIAYDERDDVTSLTYAFTTGPNTKTTIVASGYNDKPNPYSAIPHWYNVMHAGWDNSDPEPIFTALSKHNLLGYTLPDGSKRVTSYAYESHGYPSTRTQTNVTASASASHVETFEYACP